MRTLGMLLQINQLTWSTVGHQQLRGRTMSVLFAYGVLAWNRFGLLTFSAPRIPMRFLLYGVYAWLGLALVVWLASHLSSKGPATLRDAAVGTAIAHTPLVGLSFFIAIIAGFARIFGPGVIMAIFVFAFWMPALLARSFHDVARLPWAQSIGAAVVAQLVWLATLGRYLNDQVGHLL